MNQKNFLHLPPETENEKGIPKIICRWIENFPYRITANGCICSTAFAIIPWSLFWWCWSFLLSGNDPGIHFKYKVARLMVDSKKRAIFL